MGDIVKNSNDVQEKTASPDTAVEQGATEQIEHVTSTEEGKDSRASPPQRGGNRQFDIEVPENSQKRKLIISLAWPALVENIFTSIMSMISMMMVGGLANSASAIAAVGLVTQPRFIMLSIFMAMNIGTTAIIARCKGANDPESANNALRQALMLTFAFTFVLCALMLAFNEYIIRFIAGNMDEETIQLGIDYMRIQIWGFPTMSLTFAMNAALRGAGNTRATLFNTSAANVANVIFSFLLIYGALGFPRMEVEGASLAVVIGQTVGLISASFVLLQGRQYIRIRPRGWKIDMAMIKRIWNIGLPALFEQVVMRVGMLWFAVIVAGLGTIQFAAHMVAMNMQMLSFTTGMAFGTAATTLVGQSLGRQRPDLAKLYVKMTNNLGIIVSAIIAALLFIFSRQLTSLYTNEYDVINLASAMIMIVALSNPISNARFVYVASLRGAGDARFTLIITFVGILLARPAIALLLVNVFNLGLHGVWIALVSDSVICYFLAFFRYRGGKWTKIKV